MRFITFSLVVIILSAYFSAINAEEGQERDVNSMNDVQKLSLKRFLRWGGMLKKERFFAFFQSQK